MHGVKKSSPASEAQLAELKRERKEKLQKFIYGKNLVFTKRGNKEFDDELLEVTGELVKKQPNMYTVWNIRREVLEEKANKKEESEDEYTARLAEMYDGELKLSMQALLSDPKSYSAWYHRDFVLSKHPKPDFKRELEICEKALEFDCRNFHCWDHRRFTAQLAKLDESEELEFSDRLVSKNPSNYSAWHYRGTLLPKIAPNSNGNPICINDERLQQEFDKVKVPTCYNTEDQTAWTYCRWLSEVSCVGPVEPTLIVSVTFVALNQALIVFNNSVDKEFVNRTVKADTYTPISVVNLPKNDKYIKTKLWMVRRDAGFDFPVAFGVELEDGRVESVEKEGYCNKRYLKNHFAIKNLCVTETSTNILTELVEMCRELMKDDDKNPWEPLALARTLLLLKRSDKDNLAEVDAMLQKAIELDPQRRNVYQNIIDIVRITENLCHPMENLDKVISRDENEVNLSQRNIRSVSHLHYLAGHINSLVLQYNRIEDTKQFNSFPLLIHLTLDDNPVTKVHSDLRLPCLEFLSLARCQIQSSDALKCLPNVAPNLKRLLICETQLAKDEEQLKLLKDSFEQQQYHVTVIVHYL